MKSSAQRSNSMTRLPVELVDSMLNFVLVRNLSNKIRVVWNRRTKHPQAFKYFYRSPTNYDVESILSGKSGLCPFSQTFNVAVGT
jgi:hypothetical protein